MIVNPNVDVHTKTWNRWKTLRKSQKNNTLLKIKRVLKLKYKLSGGPVFTFSLPVGQFALSPPTPVSYATGKMIYSFCSSAVWLWGPQERFFDCTPAVVPLTGRNSHVVSIPIDPERRGSHVSITIDSQGIPTVNYRSTRIADRDEPPKYEDVSKVSFPVYQGKDVEEEMSADQELPSYSEVSTRCAAFSWGGGRSWCCNGRSRLKFFTVSLLEREYFVLKCREIKAENDTEGEV